MQFVWVPKFNTDTQGSKQVLDAPSLNDPASSKAAVVDLRCTQATVVQ